MQDFRVPDPLQHQAQEFQQRMDEIDLEFQQSLERTTRQIEQFQRESSQPPQTENVWPIVTLTATVFLGLAVLAVLAIREHRTRRRRQRVARQVVDRVARQAVDIVALVWDEIDPEEIRRVIDGFEIDPAHAEIFKVVMMTQAMCWPMPWYRLDIPKLLESIGRYVAGEPWSVQAEADAPDQNRDESSTTAQASADASSESLEFVPAAEEKPNQLEAICANGHTFAVPAIYAGAHRKCPQCGSRALVGYE